MSVRVRGAVTAAAGVFYVGTVALAAVLLVVVGDHTLAIALVALELSMVTGTHLVLRRSRTTLARTGPPDPSIPILDRPGHEPTSSLRVLLVMLGGIGAIAVLVIILSSAGH